MSGGRSGGAFLISGIPGVGKSTVASSLARRFERAVHIESDEVQALIVSGNVQPGETPMEESDAQLRLRTRNVCALVDNFVEAGFIAVIDDVVVFRDRLNYYLAHLRTRPLHFVVLAPPLSIALERDAKREKRVAHTWAHLDIDLRREMTGIGFWIDTFNMDAEETADLIYNAYMVGSLQDTDSQVAGG